MKKRTTAKSESFEHTMSPISWNEDASLTKDHQRRPNFDLSAPFRIGEMSPVSAGHSANSGHQSRRYFCCCGADLSKLTLRLLHPDLFFLCRNFPLSHGPAEAPICIECQALQLTFYDPNCVGCRSELVRTTKCMKIPFLKVWFSRNRLIDQMLVCLIF